MKKKFKDYHCLTKISKQDKSKAAVEVTEEEFGLTPSPMCEGCPPETLKHLMSIMAISHHAHLAAFVASAEDDLLIVEFVEDYVACTNLWVQQL